MEIEKIAKLFKELGHKTRLTIFKRLIKCGNKGLSVGDLNKELNIPNSTLSHHISALINANLIKQERKGRVLYCKVNYEALSEIILFLQDECCIEEDSN